MKGLALQDMIYRLQFLVHDRKSGAARPPDRLVAVDEIEENVKMDLLADMAEVEAQAAAGGTERAQAGALVGCFYRTAQALWQA